MRNGCSVSEPKPRVLVVDDEPQIRRFLRASLHAQGYEVEEAGDAREAILQALEDCRAR